MIEHDTHAATRNMRRSLMLRVMMVPLFVVFCYLFQWWWLRIATTLTLLKISSLLSVPMYHLGPDLIRLDSLNVQFIIPCTMIDAFFGAIPLLWQTQLAWWRNLSRLSAVFLGVFFLNIFRLEVGFVAMHYGAPWWLAHECVAGVAYFCLFLFIVHERAWGIERKHTGSPAAAIEMAAVERS